MNPVVTKKGHMLHSHHKAQVSLFKFIRACIVAGTKIGDYEEIEKKSSYILFKIFMSADSYSQKCLTSSALCYASSLCAGIIPLHPLFPELLIVKEDQVCNFTEIHGILVKKNLLKFSQRYIGKLRDFRGLQI